MAPLFTAQKATWASCWHFPRPLATRGDFTQDHAAGSRWMQAMQWASIKAGNHWAWGSHAFREPGKQASSLSRGRHYPDPQGGLQQIQPWKLVCIKNSQGLAFLAYPGEVIPLNNFPGWIWGGTSQIPSLLQVNQDGRGFPGSGLWRPHSQLTALQVHNLDCWSDMHEPVVAETCGAQTLPGTMPSPLCALFHWILTPFEKVWPLPVYHWQIKKLRFREGKDLLSVSQPVGDGGRYWPQSGCLHIPSSLAVFLFLSWSRRNGWDFLVAQWLRLHLPMQGMWVQSLVRG